jgi:WD40 repeat protein
VRIFDGFTGSPRTTISFPYDVHTVAFSTDGSRIVIDGGAGPGGVQLADPRSEKPIAPVITVRGAIGGTEFQPTSSRVIMLRFLQSAGLWDSLTGKQMGEELSPASAYEFSPDGRELITVGSSPDFSIRVWSVASRQELMRGEGHKSWGHTIAFSPDRSRILTTSADGTARMWRAKDLAPVGAVMTHDAEVFGAVFSPDGERVLSWGYDNTARLWDGQTGAPIAILPHRAAVVVGTFSPDGTRILTSSVESITRMWDGKTGQPWPCHPVMN